jgi:hypothetical protein
MSPFVHQGFTTNVFARFICALFSRSPQVSREVLCFRRMTYRVPQHSLYHAANWGTSFSLVHVRILFTPRKSTSWLHWRRPLSCHLQKFSLLEACAIQSTWIFRSFSMETGSLDTLPAGSLELDIVKMHNITHQHNTTSRRYSKQPSLLRWHSAHRQGCLPGHLVTVEIVDMKSWEAIFKRMDQFSKENSLWHLSKIIKLCPWYMCLW